MADTYPVAEDLKTFLYATQLTDHPTAPTGRYAYLDYAGVIAAAITEIERACSRTFLSASVTRTYDPPTDRDGHLDLEEEFSAITAVTIDGTALTLNEDYYRLPYNGPPYRTLHLLQRWIAPLAFETRHTVVVTGTLGPATTFPDDVFQAILRAAAAKLAPQIVQLKTRGLASFTEAGVTQQFDGKTLRELKDQWEAEVQRVVNHYTLMRL
jgi:hypothetical protein